MGEIKSAYEKAMEKIADLGEPTKEQKLEWSGVPKGQKLAAQLMKGDGNAQKTLAEVSKEERRYVLRGAMEVLAANLQLPRTAPAEAATKRALDATKALLGSSGKLNDIVSRIGYVVEQYRTNGQQQLQQYMVQLRQQFQMQVEQQMRQRGAGAAQNVNVEQLPEFQAEVMRLRARIDQQYEQHLDAFRQELKALV